MNNKVNDESYKSSKNLEQNVNKQDFEKGVHKITVPIYPKIEYTSSSSFYNLKPFETSQNSEVRKIKTSEKHIKSNERIMPNQDLQEISNTKAKVRIYSRKSLTRQSLSSYSRLKIQGEYGSVQRPRLKVCNIVLNNYNTSSASQLRRSTNPDGSSELLQQSVDIESKSQIKQNKCVFKSAKKVTKIQKDEKKQLKQAKIISLNKGVFISRINEAITKQNKNKIKNYASKHRRMRSALLEKQKAPTSKTKLSITSTKDSIKETQIQLEKLKKYVSRQISPSKDLVSGDQTIESSYLNISEFKSPNGDNKREAKDIIYKLVEKDNKLTKQYNRSDYVDSQNVIFDLRKATHKFFRSHQGFQTKQIIKRKEVDSNLREYRQPSKVSLFPPGKN